jgi:isopropylmalate/homocitrate/citramalate synthase
MTPEGVFEAMSDMIRRFPGLRFDFHPHNDYGLATANVLAAARPGPRRSTARSTAWGSGRATRAWPRWW